MTDWADREVTRLLDETPELKDVSLREIMASALRAERERCLFVVKGYYDHVPDELRDAQDPLMVYTLGILAKHIEAGE